jgi:hypothetical protein
MTYALLGQDLFETADRARDYFAQQCGAKKFICEPRLASEFPFNPTWQAILPHKYVLYVDVALAPFDSTYYEFMHRCANKNMLAYLWVAIPPGAAKPNFSSELQRAKELGVGVVQMADNAPREFHKALLTSAFGVNRTDTKAVSPKYRAALKTVEDVYLDGNPQDGCRRIAEHIESVTRRFAEHSYNAGWWKPGSSAKVPDFRRGHWAPLLEELDGRIDTKRVRQKVPSFSKTLIAHARGMTEWRNSLSHAQLTQEDLHARDARLRANFESSRNLLVDWYPIATALKLKF